MIPARTCVAPRSHLPDVIQLTRTLVGFDTINPPGHESRAAEYLADILQDFGFGVTLKEMSPGRASLIARFGKHFDCDGSAELPICFTGHLDTVPLGATPWQFDPLSGQIEEGRLYGRGSSDMKCGVAAMVCAALESRDKLAEGPGLVLVLTAAEETGCEGAIVLAAEHDLLRQAGAIIVGEPTTNLPRAGHRGALWLNALSRGRTAHGATPELGANAVYKLARVVRKLEDFGFNVEADANLGSPSLNVGRISGGLNVNSVPDRAEAAIDIRTLPSMRHVDLVDTLAAHLGPDSAELTSFLDLPGIWTDGTHPWVRRVCAIAGHDEIRLQGAPFFSDASILTPALGSPPTLLLGPGETHMAHQTDEYCELARVSAAVTIYRRIMADWQQSQ
jgi:succinyl-diaminopimelate desuccinylase